MNNQSKQAKESPDMAKVFERMLLGCLPDSNAQRGRQQLNGRGGQFVYVAKSRRERLEDVVKKKLFDEIVNAYNEQFVLSQALKYFTEQPNGAVDLVTIAEAYSVLHERFPFLTNEKVMQTLLKWDGDDEGLGLIEALLVALGVEDQAVTPEENKLTASDYRRISDEPIWKIVRENNLWNDLEQSALNLEMKKILGDDLQDLPECSLSNGDKKLQRKRKHDYR